MRKIVGESVYNMKYVGALSLGVIAISLLSNLIYENVLARYTLMLGILALYIVFRKKVMATFKSMKEKKEAAKDEQ